MIEFASVDANGTLTPDNAPQPMMVAREWDDSELLMSPRAGW